LALGRQKVRFGIILLKNLLRRKTRSLLTIIGIGIAIGAVVALISISQGYMDIWLEYADIRGTDIRVLQRSDASAGLFSSIDQSLKPKLAEVPGIKTVTGTLVDVVTIDDRPWLGIFGQEPYAYVLEHLDMVEGRMIRPGRKELIMGKLLAESLKRKVGDEVDIEADLFEVVGLFESGSMYEDGLVVTNLQELQELMMREGRVTFFEVQVESPALIGKIKESIEDAFPSLAALEEREAARGDFGLRLIRSLSWAVSSIALIVGVIGTMNTMFMSVFERTREIGILRAIGWRRGRVLKMILGESLLLSLLGGAFGCLLGVLAVEVIVLFPQTQGFVYGQYNPMVFGQAMAVALTLGVAGGLYPAYRASRLSPLEAIRYE